MCEYPKVLIVNQQSLNKNNATGITLRSLWADWPLDRVLEIYTDNYEMHVPDGLNIESICIPTNILNKLAHGKTAKKVNTEIKQESVETQETFKTSIRQAAVLALDTIPIPISKSVKNRIKKFQPEVIYTLGATVSTLQLVYRLSEKFDIPVVIHYMDNWPEHLQWESNPLIKPYRKALDKQHYKCLTRCKNGLAISPQMAEVYNKMFSIPFAAIMNSIEVESFRLKPKTVGNNIYFVYAGGLHLGRWRALLDLVNAVNDLSINGELHIYTNVSDADLYKQYFPRNVVFHRPVNHSQILDVYSAADVLVHAETDNPLLTGFFKYSISTKIPEYLASGRIVLFYGPKEMGLYDYLSKSKAAYTAGNYNELCDALSAIAKEAETGTLVNIYGYEFALKNHDIKRARATLFDCLTQPLL